ncbi:MAG: UvrD-helicase domain-containing protein [Proteobacteria bacterium]|nr:UvrD-helicase domain-containing protein [Pseudomonadota bacterium]
MSEDAAPVPGEARVHEDALARSSAADPHASVLLEAPAGAGKTAVLTQRFLRLLCEVDEPGQILAITFTRKAAAEMHARITQALQDRLGGEDAAILRPLAQAALAHGRARGWDLTQAPQALRIQTIDAFNYWLAGQLPIGSGAGSALEVTESPGAMYREAARATLAGAETDATLGADAQLLFERFDNHWANLEAMLAQMLAERGHWLPYVLEQPAEQLCQRVSAGLTAIVEAQLAQAMRRLPGPVRASAARLPGIGALDATAGSLPGWKRLGEITQTEAGWRVQISARHLGGEFAAAPVRGQLRELIEQLRGQPGAAEVLAWARRAPPAVLPADDAAALAALSRLLSRAAAVLHAEFARAGRVDYTYIMGAARAALAEAGEPTELALRTGLALRHILVDEFQDTSLAQFQLLESLTAAWEEGDGRTLFVVGDPMQSIYRFREAEVGLFLAARDAGIGRVALQPLRLRRNFRSIPALVEFTNGLFGQVFPPRDDLRAGAVAYHESVAARAAPADAAAAVTLRVFPDDRAAEAQAVAERIAQLRAQDPRARIAILVAAHAHAAPVIAALAARGVACVGVDLVPLRERVVVRDLVQLAAALHDLADRSAWLAVLRAPWCGASLHALTVLSGPRETLPVFDAMAEARRLARCEAGDAARLGRVHAVLAAALARRGSAPVADWLEATWVQLGAADAYAPQELADARAFFDALAERAAAGEWRGPADSPALLQRLFSPAVSADANPVQVMTIHRAKGLQFEHVFVPCLERNPGGGERRLLRWIDLPNESGGSDLLIAPAPAIAEETDAELDRFLKGLLKVREEHERTRLLYVAVTRARASLWLSGAPAVGADGELRIAPRSLLACLWPALGARFERPAGAPQAMAGSARGALRRLKADWSAPQLPAAAPWPHLPVGERTLEPPEFSWVGETQRQVGTLVHAYLARWAQSPVLPAQADIAAEQPAVLAQLQRHGVPERERPAAAALILRALVKTLGDARGRWILDAGHREAQSELALSGLAAGRLRAFVIDRTFIDEQGTRWVIDYKTSRHEGGGVEAFLDSEVERYRGQLAGYGELLRGLGPEPVRAGLYFPLLGAFREVAVGPV